MTDHPIKSFARNQSMTLTEFAAVAGTSRMSLHRVMSGENTTLALLRRISAATGGVVSVEDLVSVPAADHVGDVSSCAADENGIDATACHVNGDSAGLLAASQ